MENTFTKDFSDLIDLEPTDELFRTEKIVRNDLNNLVYTFDKNSNKPYFEGLLRPKKVSHHHYQNNYDYDYDYFKLQFTLLKGDSPL